MISLFSLNRLCLTISIAASCLFSLDVVAKAQSVNSDGTLPNPTQVTEQGNISEITGGTTRGNNLFHSFQDFSVNTGNEAFFNNANNISNILGRVTGGNVSNINGLIRANGSANLFLLNPAGIVFGESASLQIGGSFYGSTADSLLFSEGEFSAINTDATPILTINAPIGLSFRDNPTAITNRSVANDVGLAVASGQTLALLGGGINFTGGNVIAPGANLKLGGLSAAGTINLTEAGNISFPENINRANLTFTDGSRLDIIGNLGGSIEVKANNLEILSNSEISAGAGNNLTAGDIIAGDIEIDATGTINLDGNSRIKNVVLNGTAGNSGNINIQADSFNITNQSNLGGVVSGTGNGGNLNVKANSLSLNNSNIGNAVQGTGNGGEINIETNSLAINAGILTTSVVPGANGQSGNLSITTNSLSLANNSLVTSSNFNQLNEGTRVNSGDIEINVSESLTSTNARIASDTTGIANSGNVFINGANADLSFDGLVTIDEQQLAGGVSSAVDPGSIGNAGNISITGKSLNLSNQSAINSNTQGQGNSGNINVHIAENITLTGGVISSVVGPNALGNGGQITLSANAFSLADSAVISTATSGITEGEIASNAGNININAATSFTAQDAIIFSTTLAQGNAGNIDLKARSLALNNLAIFDSSTLGAGNAGNITFEVAENINLANGFIFSNVGIFGDLRVDSATGNGGNILLDSRSLSLTENSAITSGTLGRGNAGNINIRTQELVVVNRSSILGTVDPEGSGNGGAINIQASDVNFINGGVVNGSALGAGNAGNISIQASNNITFEGEGNSIEENTLSGVFSNVGVSSPGNGGQINLQANKINLLNGGRIDASTLGIGDAGDINVKANNAVIVNGVANSADVNNTNSGIFSAVRESSQGNGGDIEIAAGSLQVSNSGQISSSTGGAGNGGNINLEISDSIVVSGAVADNEIPSAISSLAFGTESNSNSGNIQIQADSLSLDNSSFITTLTNTSGNAGNISIDVNDQFRLSNNGGISAESQSTDGGNIDINAKFIVAFPSQEDTAGLFAGNGSDILASTVEGGTGGNISINAQQIFGAQERKAIDGNSTNDIDASSEFGIDGQVVIGQLVNNPLQGVTELPVNPIAAEQTVTEACSSNATNQNSLVVSGKGGIPSEPISPLSSENLVGDNFHTSPQTNSGNASSINAHNYIPTAIGNVIPATGIVVKENGRVELVAYSTQENQRLFAQKANCGS